MFLIYIFQTKTKSDFGVSQNPICLRSDINNTIYVVFIVESNWTQKDFIADRVLDKVGYYTASSMWNSEKERPLIVVVYRLTDYSGPLRATCPEFESHHSGE